MGIAAGKHILTGSGDQTIECGFAPDFIILLFSNHGVEDTWQQNGAVAGLGIISRRNPGIDNTPASTSTHTLWQNFTPSSSYLFDVATWSRSSHGGGGYALYGIQLNDTGFHLRYASGFAGGAGNPIYWFAIGSEDEVHVKHAWYGRGDPATIATDFEPSLVVMTGSGGFGGGHGSITVTDFSVPFWGVCRMVDDILEASSGYGHSMIMGLSEGITFINQGQFMWGEIDGLVLTADPITAGQLILNSFFSLSRTETSLTVHRIAGGFDGPNARMGMSILGGLQGYTGFFTPSSTLNGFVDVDIPLDVRAVIFFNSNFWTESFGNEISGGRSMGFVAEDGNQAVVANGGHYSSVSHAMGNFQSGLNAWVSNFGDGPSGVDGAINPSNYTEGNFGIDGSYGTAEITPNGFRATTKGNGHSMRPVAYMALGLADEAPGFFRVINR